ncbi:hypothetical protein QQS21_004674 [Conoideocrella luteorostrata]|uniref:Uncharacterized protein n=1 Tax=Conoideocrella luteorostrata TaxID=1105319 RepID=A0AAJ0CTE1_9HYPO|nr:hypothetical protein QQS21_004674 [Conoideocrella luteorostrata]
MPESPTSFSTLSDRVAIVTGASRGIGHGITWELAKRGAKVTAVYESPNSLKAIDELVETVASLKNGSQCIGVQADLREPSSGALIVRQTVAAFGHHIDILVNNAGTELVKPIQDISVEDFDSVYHLNVRAPMLLLQHVLPHLRAPGRIINVGAVGARQGFKDLSIYCSSKAAIEGLTRCWAAELGANEHTVNL